jgi:hypothetical protein
MSVDRLLVRFFCAEGMGRGGLSTRVVKNPQFHADFTGISTRVAKNLQFHADFTGISTRVAKNLQFHADFTGISTRVAKNPQFHADSDLFPLSSNIFVSI